MIQTRQEWRNDLAGEFLAGIGPGLRISSEELTHAITTFVEQALDNDLISGKENYPVPPEAFQDTPYQVGDYTTDSMRRTLSLLHRAIKDGHEGISLLIALYRGAFFKGILVENRARFRQIDTQKDRIKKLERQLKDARSRGYAR